MYVTPSNSGRIFITFGGPQAHGALGMTGGTVFPPPAKLSSFILNTSSNRSEELIEPKRLTDKKSLYYRYIKIYKISAPLVEAEVVPC
jgi:hypothetical protein